VLRTLISLPAVCGLGVAALLFVGHLPFDWVGDGGTTFAGLPSLMMAG
jgi:hypothetical protein